VKAVAAIGFQWSRRIEIPRDRVGGFRSRHCNARPLLLGGVDHLHTTIFGGERIGCQRGAWKPRIAFGVTQIRLLGILLSTSVQAEKQGPSTITR
jgi:hypothetical protein